MALQFSIIMPLYNGRQYIQNALKSIAEQRYSDYELILVDDASTDGTVELVRADASFKRINNVSILCLEHNAGIGNARNTGMAVAKGEYLIFIDQDDELEPDALCHIEQKLRQEACDICAYGFSRIDAHDNILMRLPVVVKTGDALRWDLCMVWTYALRRQFAVDHQLRFPIQAMNEDMIFSMQAARYTNRIALIEACLYRHRVNPESTSTRMAQRFDRYPLSRELIYKTAKESYDYVADAKAKQEVLLAMLAYHYSIWFGIFKTEPKAVKLKEYRMHRACLEKYFGDYLHSFRIPLGIPKSRRFIYRSVVYVSFRMEKYLGQRFYEWFICLWRG